MIEHLQISYSWVQQFVWRALPLIATIIIMMIATAPVHLLQGIVPAPDIALTSVFFWAMHGPSFMPPWAVFVIGVTQDLSMGTAAGFWVLIYLFAYGFTLTQRVFFKGRTGIGVWLGFALVVSISCVVAWLLDMLMQERWLDPTEVLLQGAVTLVFYPVLARLFVLVRKLLTNAPETL